MAGSHGATIFASPFTVTATFTSPVSGLTASDIDIVAGPGPRKVERTRFQKDPDNVNGAEGAFANWDGEYQWVASAGATVTGVRLPVGSTSPSTTWEITVAVVDPTNPSSISLKIPAGTGVVSPAPLDSAPFVVGYTPDYTTGEEPLHNWDPCVGALAAGLCGGPRAAGCTASPSSSDVTTPFSCKCRPFYFGEHCDQFCPPPYRMFTSNGISRCYAFSEKVAFASLELTEVDRRCPEPVFYNNGGLGYSIDLASVHSADEGLALRDFCYDLRSAGCEAVAATDADAEGRWRWMDRSMWTDFSDMWGSGQPDNFNNVEHCATILADGKLNDKSCDNVDFFVPCQIQGVEQERWCTNGVQDAATGETAVDCGGVCGACPTGVPTPSF